MTLSVACIAVSYHGDEHAVRWAQSLAAASREVDFSFVLVDNTERHDAGALFARIEAVVPGALCLSPGTNLGYFGGARHGLDRLLERRPSPDWIMVSNVDLEVAGDDFWGPLARLDQLSDVGVVGPSIWSDLGKRDLNPRYTTRPEARRVRSYPWIFRHRWVLNAYEALSYVKHHAAAWSRIPTHGAAAPARAPDCQPNRIYAVHGSCLLFSRRFFECGGTLAYPGFLFGEELFVAETARRLGLGVYHEPRMRVVHDEHSATGVFRSRAVARHVYDSARYVADTFFAD